MPGVTAHTITVGIGGAFGNGDLQQVVSEDTEGLLVWERAVNASGGIYGRKVILKYYDHKDTTAGAIAACHQILSDHAVLFEDTAQSTTDAHIVLANCLDQAGQFNVVYQTTAQYASVWKHTYTYFPTPEEMGTITANFAALHTAKSTKIGVITTSSDIYSVVGDSTASSLKANGYDVVDVEHLDPNATSFIPNLERLRASGATTVIYSTIVQDATILKEAKQIGYAPKWIGTQGTFDFAPQANPGAYNGVIGVRYTATTDSPAYATFVELWKKYSTIKSPPTGDDMGSYGDGLIIGAILKAAGPHPTPQSAEAGIQTIHNLVTNIWPPISWGPGKYQGNNEFWPARCCSAQNTWVGTGPPSDFAGS